MDLKAMQQLGLIEPFAASLQEVDSLLELADRDLVTARSVLPISPDWGLAIAYNAALQAILGLMYAYDYRPRGANMHKTAVDFAAAVLGMPLQERVSQLNRLRRKRHQAVYHAAGLVSPSEAESTLRFAERFVEELKLAIRDKLAE